MRQVAFTSANLNVKPVQYRCNKVFFASTHTAIIASEETIPKLEHPENLYFRYLETVRVKGKSNSVAIKVMLTKE